MKSAFFISALEDTNDVEKQIAVIIKGNPKYLQDKKVKLLAKEFYTEIQNILETKGYIVEFDEGKDYTKPRCDAKVWIGHSRGISRLQFAPKEIKVIALQTLDHGKFYKNNDEQGLDPDHYKLSPKDKKAFNNL